jgi:hypothetical protein
VVAEGPEGVAADDAGASMESFAMEEREVVLGGLHDGAPTPADV